MENQPVLALGAKGDSVKQLQELLIKWGFKAQTDGEYGVRTDLAIRNFQDQNNLDIDGIVGPKTWETLLKVNAQ